MFLIVLSPVIESILPQASYLYFTLTIPLISIILLIFPVKSRTYIL